MAGEDRSNPADFPVKRGVSLLGCWSFSREVHVAPIGDEFGAVFGPFRFDAIQGHLQSFCILVDGALDTLTEIAVYVIPTLWVVGELVFFPPGDVSPDKFEP